MLKQKYYTFNQHRSNAWVIVQGVYRVEKTHYPITPLRKQFYISSIPTIYQLYIVGRDAGQEEYFLPYRIIFE